ncbi:MAG: PEP-CTERM sorting domain-containing protein [Verrucomicrobiaceae bacterium]|nr:PEP-CTERM sorting domain-containing protein [Verrucomicrobiaceae bacterium]
MTSPTQLLTKLACAGLLFACSATSQARQVAWGSSVEDNLFDSSGSIANGNFRLDSSFSFEIGVFANGFTPTSSNLSDWEANWLVFDAANTSIVDSWTPELGYFSGVANLNSNGTSGSASASPTSIFTQNQVGYLWVFNDKAIASTSEWALVTDLISAGNVGDAWRMPDPNDQISTDLFWALQDADTVIFGGLNDVQGPGAYTNDPANDPGIVPVAGTGVIYSLQTHAVPEPGSALFLASAGFFWMLRKRRYKRMS